MKPRTQPSTAHCREHNVSRYSVGRGLASDVLLDEVGVQALQALAHGTAAAIADDATVHLTHGRQSAESARHKYLVRPIHLLGSLASAYRALLAAAEALDE